MIQTLGMLVHHAHRQDCGMANLIGFELPDLHLLIPKALVGVQRLTQS